MKKKVRARAIEALKGTPLPGRKHMPNIYIVGDKLFTMRYAAVGYRKEWLPGKTIERVTINEAYGVADRDKLPEGVRVDWGFGND